jgi:hypothetical protein
MDLKLAWLSGSSTVRTASVSRMIATPQLPVYL